MKSSSSDISKKERLLQKYTCADPEQPKARQSSSTDKVDALTSDDSKGKTGGKCLRYVFIVVLVVSLLANAALVLPAYLYLEPILSQLLGPGDTGAAPAPAPAPSPSILNSSCPFSNGTHDGEFMLSMYQQSDSQISVCWPRSKHKAWFQAPYILKQDNWYGGKPDLWPVYSGRGSNFTTALDSLLPGQPVTFQLEVWSSPTADIDPRQEQSDTYTFYVPEKKHCGNRNDLEIYRNAKALDMGGKIETCVKAIFSNRDQKIKCIVDALGMSEGCAGCWADETQCIENNCIMPCLGTSQDKCNACINKYCMPAVAECAGLPEWALNISLIVK